MQPETEADTNIIPDAFLCPISQEMMVDPVVAADGHTYERKSIQQWLNRGSKISPMTGQPLKHVQLTENHAIRKAIDQFKVTYALKKQGKSKGFSYSGDNEDGIASEYKAKIQQLQRQLEKERRMKQVIPSTVPIIDQKTSTPRTQERPHRVQNAQKNSSILACFGFGQRNRKMTNSEADLQEIAQREGWTQITDWINSGTSLKSVEVLFLYQRSLNRIEGINCMTGLKRLGLHNNKIRKIQNIDRLTSLKYLGLGYNFIQKIEGLNTLRSLQELDLYQNRINKIQNLIQLQALKKLIISKNPAIQRIGIMGLFEKINQQPGLIDALRKRGISITIGVFF